MNLEENIKIQNIENSELLQQYFDNFQKEIAGNEVNIQIAADDEEIIDDTNEQGTYFMDQQGHYYFQANSDSQSTLLTEAAIDDGTREICETNEDVTIVDGNEEIRINNESGNQVLIPGQVYQTVTIVPSEAANGEVSYVLIVQQPDEKAMEHCEVIESQQDANLTVYDFDETEELEITHNMMDSDDEDDKSKIIKLPQKKSQSVAAAHMCTYCNYTSPKRYLLSRHMKSHSEERPHKCSVCERGFKTLASLQNHVNTHTGTKPHRCRFCESAFTTSGELVRHVRYRHTHEKPHKCHECDYASVELSKLKRHVRCHTGERPYQCQHCTYASPDTFKLKRHMRTHTHEKPYECDYCKMRFTQSNSLKAHKLIHNIGDKPIYPCQLCPTTCGRKTDLRIHIQKLHTSDKPLKCKRCGKSFPDRYNYKMHNKTHEGEKCFKCDMCPYASISQRHLNSHMLIHTDEKPFACEKCDQTFRQKQLLKRHQNLYHNPTYIPPSPKEKSHECQECGRQFRHKGNLIRHMAMHDPDSAVYENSLALKLGRQKKIHIIDGQSVEVVAGPSLESEEEDMEEMEGTSNDMEQYVVLEVIQLQGENSHDPAAVKRDVYDDMQEVDDKNDGEEEECDKKVDALTTKSCDTDKDMKTCFGFDEEDTETQQLGEMDDDVIWVHGSASNFQ